MTRRVKIGLAAGTFILVAGGGIAGVSARGETGVSVRAETVELRALESAVRASGWIQPRVSMDVQSDIMGRVTGLYVQEGDDGWRRATSCCASTPPSTRRPWPGRGPG
jgi:multidrug efflux pump subunit AcrA (membrane-fusion protein)